MSTRTRTATFLVAVALVAAGCSGGGDDPAGGGNSGDNQLTVWTIEDVQDRVQAQKKMIDAFTQQTGIKVTLVAVAEDQFDQTITSAAAADTLPDVIAAIPLSPLRMF